MVSAGFFLAVAFTSLLSLGSAHSQSIAPGNSHKGWDLQAWTAVETGEENLNSFSQAQILTAGFSLGKILTHEIGSGWRRGRIEYGFSLIPVFRQFRPQSLYGGGFEPVILRWNSSPRAGRVSPYIEVAGGGVRTNANLPAGDTSNFNFTARGGGGIQLRTGQSRALDIGCRWSHISNANLGVRNPEFNGIQISFGYHWLW